MTALSPSSMRRVTASLAALAVLLAGCGDDSRLGPPTPTGAIDIGGPPMTSLPPPPDGWSLKEVVPQSQQQAQDTIADYLRRTAAGLPAGTIYDSGRFPKTGDNIPCDDDFMRPGEPPTNFTTTGNLVFPEGSDTNAMIAKTGEVWRSWGWYVIERDGFRKPNQFGYGPDGYRLQIVAPNPPQYPPVVSAMSPCYPGDIARDDVPFPGKIAAQG